MSSLGFSMKPRNGGGGSSGGYPIRRQRSAPKLQQRMSLTSSPSFRRSNKIRPLTPTRPRSKSRQRNVGSRMELCSTSARKDPTLKRNKDFWAQQQLEARRQRQQKARAQENRTDIGTARETNKDSDREDAAENVPREIVKVPSEEEPEPTVVDRFGDAVVEANDAMVALVCDNKAVTKMVFPYMDGEYYNPEQEKNDKPEGGSFDFYTGLNHTLSEEGFEATYAAETKAVEENSDKKTGHLGVGHLGMLMMLQKVMRNNKGGNADAELSDCVKTFEEGRDEGIEVQQGKDAEEEGLSEEAEVLLSMYDPGLDKSNTQETDEGTTVEGQDLEVEMLGDSNVLAVGFGAFAVCGADENTIVTEDQQELTLQDHSNQDKQKKTRMELLKEKRALLRRMKAKNLNAAKKALASEETKSPPPDIKEGGAPSLRQEWALNKNSDEKKLAPIDEDNTIQTADNKECTLDDYKQPTLFSRISSFKRNRSHLKPSIENDNAIATSENCEGAPLNDSSNAAKADNVKETKEQDVQADDLLAARLAAFSTDDLIMKSFEVDDGISMHSSVSTPTAVKSRCSADSRHADDDSLEIEESFTEESETSSMGDDASYEVPWWKFVENAVVKGVRAKFLWQ